MREEDDIDTYAWLRDQQPARIDITCTLLVAAASLAIVAFFAWRLL